MDEKLPPYAPEELFTAQGDAKKELVELENKIPTVRMRGAHVWRGWANLARYQIRASAG